MKDRLVKFLKENGLVGNGPEGEIYRIGQNKALFSMLGKEKITPGELLRVVLLKHVVRPQKKKERKREKKEKEKKEEKNKENWARNKR